MADAAASGILQRPWRRGAPASFDQVRSLVLDLHKAVVASTQELDGDARLGRLALDLARLFGESSTPRDFSAAALDAVGQTMKAARAWVLLFGEDAASASILATRGVTSTDGSQASSACSRSILARLVATGASVLEQDAAGQHEETSIVAAGLRSVLASPLVLDGRVGGAIYLENSTIASAFREEDRLRLEAIARLLAPYIQVGRRLEAALEERERLEAVLEGESSYRDFVGQSPAVRRLLDTVERLRSSDAPVLIQGESGTGKELVARALHYSSRRASRPLVTVNCAAIPEGLMESELFGHERGAFTGATERKKGKFEQADGGTLFLDEVGELRYDLQAKLLRVLQEQSFERVGGAEPIRTDVRLVAATNRDLRKLVEGKTFREDLFYRLDVVPIAIPPLRERSQDVPLLVEHFLAGFARDTGKRVRFDPAVSEILVRYPWPGNVRELRNLVYRLVALAAGDRVSVEDLPEHLTGSRTVSLDKDPFRRFFRSTPETNEEYKAAREAMEALYQDYVSRLQAGFLRGALERAGGNVARAARLAGMNRTLFHRRLAELKDED